MSETLNYTPYDLHYDTGFVQSTIPEKFRQSILNEIERIQETKEHPYNNGLVGVIKNEHGMKDLTTNQEFVEWLVALAKAYDNHYDDVHERRKDLGGGLKPRKEFWVNYQNKHEYNPVHTHSGYYSFVIWVKVPYDIKEEKELYRDARSLDGVCNFSFVYMTDTITTYPIDVDKSYEWEIVLFPSWRAHTVTPFMTSDEPRISIAGNLTSTLVDDTMI